MQGLYAVVHSCEDVHGEIVFRIEWVLQMPMSFLSLFVRPPGSRGSADSAEIPMFECE